MEAVRTTDSQFRRSIRFRERVRKRKPTQSANQHRLRALDGTALHAGFARYFTPPPLENVDQGTISKFAGTTNEPDR